MPIENEEEPLRLDTPVKEALEEEARQRLERRQSNKKKLLKKTPTPESDTSDEEADDVVPLTSDSDEPDADEVNEETLLIEKGAFVVVQYNTKKTSRVFTGQVNHHQRSGGHL